FRPTLIVRGIVQEAAVRTNRFAYRGDESVPDVRWICCHISSDTRQFLRCRQKCNNGGIIPRALPEEMHHKALVPLLKPPASPNAHFDHRSGYPSSEPECCDRRVSLPHVWRESLPFAPLPNSHHGSKIRTHLLPALLFQDLPNALDDSLAAFDRQPL